MLDGWSIEEEFRLTGIAEEPGEVDPRLLKTAKARLHRFLDDMDLDEILDRLWRQAPSIKEDGWYEHESD